MDPEKTFVTAQRIFGGVHPFSFFLFLADVRFVYHFVLRGRADSMLSGAAVRGPNTTLLQLSAAPPFLSTTSWHVLPCAFWLLITLFTLAV